MDDEKIIVDPSSTKFTEGVEAGLNSSEDTTNWRAGNELGRDLKDDDENPPKTGGVPLFMRNPGNNKSSDQDEKDESAE
jgi:hypothetical protein